METKFKNMNAAEYFTDYSKDFVLTCYEYFLAKEPKGGFTNIYVPESEGDPPFYEKLLCVLSYINNFFEADVFQLLPDTYATNEEIAHSSGSSLPSMKLSGTHLMFTNLLYRGYLNPGVLFL